jgi:hypothetical protein
MRELKKVSVFIRKATKIASDINHTKRAKLQYFANEFIEVYGSETWSVILISKRRERCPPKSFNKIIFTQLARIHKLVDQWRIIQYAKCQYSHWFDQN